MFDIIKTQEPNSFTVYKSDPLSTYAGMPSNVKDKLKIKLLEDQHYLCAYCMSKINVKNMKIEHFVPQSNNPSLELDFSNLFAVCKGREGSSWDRQTCDTRKGNHTLSFSLINGSLLGAISYKSANGEILFPGYQYELDSILNLNDNFGYLKENRKSALRAFQKKIHKKYSGKKVSRAERSKFVLKFMHEAKRREYLGIIIWYLNR